MTGIEIFLFLAGGLIMLYAGGEGLVRGSSSLALRAGISPLVIGLTVVAFGTSSPELIVSVKAALQKNSAISLGNVIGSNIANIALILGISAIIRPLNVHLNVIRREIPIMIFVTVILIFFLIDGNISSTNGFILVTLLVFYVIISIYLSNKEKNKEAEKEFANEIKTNLSLPIAALMVLAGLALLIIGADLFIKGAVALARIFKVSDIIIGLTVVAVGTSLPELITSMVAAFKKESDIAIGNVVGSNIFNILDILGIASIITPISTKEVNSIDILVLIITSIVLLPLSWSGLRITRLEGIVLVIGYFIYVYSMIPK